MKTLKQLGFLLIFSLALIVTACKKKNLEDQTIEEQIEQKLGSDSHVVNNKRDRLYRVGKTKRQTLNSTKNKFAHLDQQHKS